jgi:hypothetical protein
MQYVACARASALPIASAPFVLLRLPHIPFDGSLRRLGGCRGGAIGVTVRGTLLGCPRAPCALWWDVRTATRCAPCGVRSD